MFGTLSNAVRSFRKGLYKGSRAYAGGAGAAGGDYGFDRSELGKRRADDSGSGSNKYARTESSGSYGGRRKAYGVPSRYRGTFRRSGYYGRYTRGAQLRRLRRGLHIEKKFFDTTQTFAVDATAEVVATGQLCLIPQGVTESTRVGRTCQVKSLQIHMNGIYVPGADTVGSTTIYIALVLDKQCNGAAAAVTDILTGTNMTTALVNMANSDRFRIIRRWTKCMQAGAGVSGAFGRDAWQIDDFIKLNFQLEFSSTTGAITELKSNNLFIIAGSDQTTDDEVTFSGTARLRFTDI